MHPPCLLRQRRTSSISPLKRNGQHARHGRLSIFIPGRKRSPAKESVGPPPLKVIGRLSASGITPTFGRLLVARTLRVLCNTRPVVSRHRPRALTTGKINRTATYPPYAAARRAPSWNRSPRACTRGESPQTGRPAWSESYHAPARAGSHHAQEGPAFLPDLRARARGEPPLPYWLHRYQ